ncbi:DUF4232 domain-containing protein [Streptomyces sp.]|uniref:DUF4232 domain-containing protein n=1 Tax=Streptomyces sp. TaxID=1931 RepID=UPI002F3F0824
MALLTVAGCGASSSGSASGTPPAPATTTSGTAAPSPTTGSPAPPAASPRATTPAPPATPSATPQPPASTARTGSPRCTVTDLRMRLGRGDPGAGNIYYPLRFTNASGHPCVLNGFPGVSLLRGDGSVIGRPADREGPRGTPVRVDPGETVQADLHSLNRGVKGNSCWREPTLLKVYPPGSTDAMTLATSSPLVCGDTFDVGAVH